jgi:hypothetical protein
MDCGEHVPTRAESFSLSKGLSVVQDSGTVYTGIAQTAERSIEADRVAQVILFPFFSNSSDLIRGAIWWHFWWTSARHQKQPLATRDSGRSSSARRKGSERGGFHSKTSGWRSSGHRAAKIHRKCKLECVKGGRDTPSHR